MSRPFVAPNIEGNSGGSGQIRTSSSVGPGQGGAPPAGGGGGYVEMRMSGPGGDSARGRSGGAGGRSDGTVGARSGDHGGDSGGVRSGSLTNLPKDVQDRMLFDAESASFFAFAVEKLGIEKCKAIVRASLDNKDIREALLQPDMFGSDFDTIEKNWQSWLMQQKPEGPAKIQIMAAPTAKPAAKP